MLPPDLSTGSARCARFRRGPAGDTTSPHVSASPAAAGVMAPTRPTRVMSVGVVSRWKWGGHCRSDPLWPSDGESGEVGTAASSSCPLLLASSTPASLFWTTSMGSTMDPAGLGPFAAVSTNGAREPRRAERVPEASVTATTAGSGTADGADVAPLSRFCCASAALGRRPGRAVAALALTSALATEKPAPLDAACGSAAPLSRSIAALAASTFGSSLGSALSPAPERVWLAPAASLATPAVGGEAAGDNDSNAAGKTCGRGTGCGSTGGTISGAVSVEGGSVLVGSNDGGCSSGGAGVRLPPANQGIGNSKAEEDSAAADAAAAAAAAAAAGASKIAAGNDAAIAAAAGDDDGSGGAIAGMQGGMRGGKAPEPNPPELERDPAMPALATPLPGGGGISGSMIEEPQTPAPDSRQAWTNDGNDKTGGAAAGESPGAGLCTNPTPDLVPVGPAAARAKTEGGVSSLLGLLKIWRSVSCLLPLRLCSGLMRPPFTCPGPPRRGDIGPGSVPGQAPFGPGVCTIRGMRPPLRRFLITKSE